MSAAPSIARIQKFGGGLCCYLDKRVLESVALKKGDFVAVRTDGRTIVIERVPIEELAVIRKGTGNYRVVTG